MSSIGFFSILPSNCGMTVADFVGPYGEHALLKYSNKVYLFTPSVAFNNRLADPKKRLIGEVRIDHKKDGFFLHNFFNWCLKVKKHTLF